MLNISYIRYVTFFMFTTLPLPFQFLVHAWKEPEMRLVYQFVEKIGVRTMQTVTVELRNLTMNRLSGF